MPFETAVFMVLDNDVYKLVGSLINVLYLSWSGIEVFVVAIKLKESNLKVPIFISLETDELTNVTKSALIFMELAVAITMLSCAKLSR